MLDVGTHSTEPVDYPDFAAAVGAAVRGRRAERGILLCGSGVGASMAANKIPGIRAGLCHDTYSAHQGVEHDDMNVLVLGGRVDRRRAGARAGSRVPQRPLHRRAAASAPARKDDGPRESAARTPGVRPVGLARLHPPQPDHQRRAARLIDEDGAARRDVESVDLREGDRRQLRLPRRARVARVARRRIAKALYERLAVRDIQDAADVLRSVYDETAGADGYVSLEVSPLLAYDTRGTLDEARRLWRQSAARI